MPTKIGAVSSVLSRYAWKLKTQTCVKSTKDEPFFSDLSLYPMFFSAVITWNCVRVIDLSAETHLQSYFATQETTKRLGSSIQTVQLGRALTSVLINPSLTIFRTLLFLHNICDFSIQIAMQLGNPLSPSQQGLYLLMTVYCSLL